MKTNTIFSLFFCLILLAVPFSVHAEEEDKNLPLGFDPRMNPLTESVDHSTWDQFLKKYVNEEGEVNYAGIKEDPSLLYEYLDEVKSFPDVQLGLWPREERLALMLNAYHAGMIKIVLEHYPVRSVQEIPGVWEMTAVNIGTSGKGMSLNQMRESMIEQFRDEKIHLALSCGARGCPRLRAEAFDGPRVEGQLFLAAREFVNDNQFNKVDPKKGEVWLSQVFQWYNEDFILDFGNPETLPQLNRLDAAVISFFAYYLENPESLQYLEDNRFKIRYILFDWDLNDWAGPSAITPS